MPQSVFYVDMDVTGGYEAARRSPSMCPGGEDRALNMLLSLLQKVAAKDDRGRPCSGRCGMGGSGHYVKMIHNGMHFKSYRHQSSFRIPSMNTKNPEIYLLIYSIHLTEPCMT